MRRPTKLIAQLLAFMTGGAILGLAIWLAFGERFTSHALVSLTSGTPGYDKAAGFFERVFDEVYSREFLVGLIRDEHLYPEQQARIPIDDVVELHRKLQDRSRLKTDIETSDLSRSAEYFGDFAVTFVYPDREARRRAIARMTERALATARELAATPEYAGFQLQPIGQPEPRAGGGEPSWQTRFRVVAPFSLKRDQAATGQLMSRVRAEALSDASLSRIALQSNQRAGLGGALLESKLLESERTGPDDKADNLEWTFATPSRGGDDLDSARSRLNDFKKNLHIRQAHNVLEISCTANDPKIAKSRAAAVVSRITDVALQLQQASLAAAKRPDLGNPSDFCEVLVHANLPRESDGPECWPLVLGMTLAGAFTWWLRLESSRNP